MPVVTKPRDAAYLEVIIKPIRVCAAYKPKFGRGGKTGLDLADFQALYGADPFYSWFGLDNPLMYTAHKVAGGMTSVYRQIGIGCERLFRRILRDQLAPVRIGCQVVLHDGRSQQEETDTLPRRPDTARQT